MCYRRRNVSGVARFSVPKRLRKSSLEPNIPFHPRHSINFHSMVLSCRKASWFSIPWSFPAGKRHGFPFHGPFLQESVMVFHSMILSCRKASWFSIPWSFPAGKRHGFPFHGPFLQESVMVFHSMIVTFSRGHVSFCTLPTRTGSVRRIWRSPV